jgi:hypothetical protein
LYKLSQLCRHIKEWCAKHASVLRSRGKEIFSLSLKSFKLFYILKVISVEQVIDESDKMAETEFKKLESKVNKPTKEA